MTYRKLWWASSVLLALLAIAGIWGVYATHQIALSDSEVQERVDKQLDKDFPVKGPAHLLVQSVKLQGATVHFEDGLVVALIDLDGMLRTGKKFTITAAATGSPSYSGGEFYFQPENVE